MRKINIGFIGAGVMAKTHAKALTNVAHVYNDGILPVLKKVADVNGAAAKALAETYGFADFGTDFMEVINDPEIELVVITTPNDFHAEISEAAAKAGKHILCEKPLASTTPAAKESWKEIEKAGVVNMVGYLNTWNPVIVRACEILKSGELGDVLFSRFFYNMEYCLDPKSPHTWRQYSPVAGALGDLGSHVLSLSDFLIGEIDEVCATSDIITKERPNPNGDGSMLPVKNDDQTCMIFRYKNGSMGNLVTSRVAAGHRCEIGFEVQCSRGTVYYTHDRMNELQVYRLDDAPEDRGFKVVRATACHGDYGVFNCSAGIGYIEFATIQDHALLKAVVDNSKLFTDFEMGYKMCAVMDACLKSNDEHRWVKVSECE